MGKGERDPTIVGGWCLGRGGKCGGEGKDFIRLSLGCQSCGPCWIYINIESSSQVAGSVLRETDGTSLESLLPGSLVSTKVWVDAQTCKYSLLWLEFISLINHLICFSTSPVHF